jgi:cytochrome b561
MQPIDANATRYDRRTIAFHWLTAFLVAFQWGGAQMIDWFPRGLPRIEARSVHIVTGVALAVIIVVRLVWRLTRGRRLPPAGEGVVQHASHAVHWAMYLLLGAMSIVGVSLAWVRGDSLFGLLTIPAFDPGNRALVHSVQEIHETVGWIILTVAGLHAAAALVHHFVLKDGVLLRMSPHDR